MYGEFQTYEGRRKPCRAKKGCKTFAQFRRILRIPPEDRDWNDPPEVWVYYCPAHKEEAEAHAR